MPRVGADERLELSDELGMAAEGQPGLGVELRRAQVQLLEPRDLAGRLPVVLRAGKDGPAPLGERFHSGCGGRGGVPLVEALPCFDGGALEADGVDLLGLDVEQVAGRPRDEQLGSARRSRETGTWIEFSALPGGASPQRSATRVGAGTSRPARSRSRPSTACCRGAPRSSSSPSAATASGPRIRKLSDALTWVRLRTYHACSAESAESPASRAVSAPLRRAF